MSKCSEALKFIQFADSESKEIIEKELQEHEQYRAIEEELGIDLAALNKVAKEGIKFKTKKGIEHRTTHGLYVDFGGKCLLSTIHMSIYNKYFYFDDYGKSWVCESEEFR